MFDIKFAIVGWLIGNIEKCHQSVALWNGNIFFVFKYRLKLLSNSFDWNGFSCWWPGKVNVKWIIYMMWSEMEVIRNSSIAESLFFLLIQWILLIVFFFYGMQIDADIIDIDLQAFRRSISEDSEIERCKEKKIHNESSRNRIMCAQYSAWNDFTERRWMPVNRLEQWWRQALLCPRVQQKSCFFHSVKALLSVWVILHSIFTPFNFTPLKFHSLRFLLILPLHTNFLLIQWEFYSTDFLELEWKKCLCLSWSQESLFKQVASV